MSDSREMAILHGFGELVRMPVNRRTFCRLLGGGIVVLVTAKPAELFAQQRAYPEDLNAYLRIAPDGMVNFYGPNDVVQQATIQNQRLQVNSRSTDLDCGIMNGFLACNARFDTWYAALNLTKQ